MTTVLLGNNRFVDCHALLGLHEQSVLQVLTAPLRVSLLIPPGLPSGITFEVRENAIVQSPGQAALCLRIVARDTSVGIFWGDVSLVLAVLFDPSTVHLRVDLRPLGVNFYDDIQGLHVGGNALARNAFSNCTTAIALG